MRAGATDKWVTLSQGPQTEDGPFQPLDPEGVWAALEPLPGGGARTSFFLLRMRYHAGVTVDTRVQYDDVRRGRVRSFFVRDFRDLNEKGDEMQLEVEEIHP